MTAIQARATHIPTTASHVSLGRQLRSELIKLLSVRGTWWSVVIVACFAPLSARQFRLSTRK